MNAAVDMSQVIIPRSDQINADTLLAGPMTVTIRDVAIRGGQEQPVSIMLEETDLAFRPCKSMSRVLVNAWGPDASQYIGRSLTLYRDPSVKWGGLEVGGIRISHMTHISGEMVMQLTATKGKRNPCIIKPLVMNAANPDADRDKAIDWAKSHIFALESATSFDGLNETHDKAKKALAKMSASYPDIFQRIDDAYRTCAVDIAPAEQGRADAEHGDQFAGDES